jgi:hypothetical protein
LVAGPSAFGGGSFDCDCATGKYGAYCLVWILLAGVYSLGFCLLLADWVGGSTIVFLLVSPGGSRYALGDVHVGETIWEPVG